MKTVKNLYSTPSPTGIHIPTMKSTLHGELRKESVICLIYFWMAAFRMGSRSARS